MARRFFVARPPRVASDGVLSALKRLAPGNPRGHGRREAFDDALRILELS
jgi:hypothetical protein